MEAFRAGVLAAPGREGSLYCGECGDRFGEQSPRSSRWKGLCVACGYDASDRDFETEERVPASEGGDRENKGDEGEEKNDDKSDERVCV